MRLLLFLLHINVLCYVSFCSEMLSNGDTVNLETICRQINSKYVQDYISTYSIFFVRGEPVRIGRAKPATIERIQRLFQIVSADQDRKLIIEYQAGASTLSHDGSLSSYTDQAPHDSDIAMGIFLHLCDAGSESSTRLFTHKFSLEHYVDVVTSIPEPSLPGLSRGIDKVGIVRDDREYRQARGDRGILANIGGHFSSARDEEERPHFNVYVTHDYRKGTSARIQNTTPANHFSSYGTPYQPWPEGAVGIELLSVIDGRQNVFECVIVLLVELVRRHDPSVRDFGRGSTLYRLILDVFRANDWKELGVLLKVPPAPLALTHSTSIGRTTTS